MENIRTEFIARLKDMPKEYADKAIKAFDMTIKDYEFSVKEKALSINVFTIPREVNLYLDCMEVEGLSKKLLKNRKIVLNQFFCYIAKPVKDINSMDVRSFINSYQEQRKVCGGTLNTYRTHLSAFFNWCESEEIITKNPTKTVKPIKYEQKRRVSLTQYELETLRSACENSMEKCLIEIFFSTGCRVSELEQLKIEDIDLVQNIAVVHGKGKKMREVFINAKAKVSLTEYLKTRTDDCEYLFISERKVEGKVVNASTKVLQARISKISKRTQIGKKITPHIMRHTTASISLANGMPIESIQQMLGHASCSTTLVYADVSTAKVHSEHLRCVI